MQLKKILTPLEKIRTVNAWSYEAIPIILYPPDPSNLGTLMLFFSSQLITYMTGSVHSNFQVSDLR